MRTVSSIDRGIYRSKEEIMAIETVGPPPELFVSTITACARFVDIKHVDFSALHSHVNLSAPITMSDTKDVILSSSVGGFAGQCSVCVLVNRVGMEPRKINVKIFHNASLQCTGIDHPATGLKALRAIQQLCRSFFGDTSVYCIGDYRTVNINSTYRFNKKILQDVLYRLLFKTYGLFVMFDTTHYPGVNMKYFHNIATLDNGGVCKCDKPCIGKGDGDGPGRCRRLTVSIFRSGIVLITGSRNYRQLSDVYKFIKNIFRKHHDDIVAPVFDLKPSDD